MTSLDILHHRLAAQKLVGTTTSPLEVVQWLGAVQAQDYAGALWAVAQRTNNANAASVSAAFARGDILRTHVMRPTWHLIANHDIRWMIELSRPRLLQAMAYYYRQFNLTETEFNKTETVLHKTLEGGTHLTRPQLAAILAAHQIDVQDGVRLAHILAHAETIGLICSGAPAGKQQTYALVSERAPHAQSLDREAAIAKLTQRFFMSHGPATLADYAWWAGLTKAEALQGLEAVQHLLHHEQFNDQTYWFTHTSQYPAEAAAYLLPNYDEYVVAYTDRSLLFDPAHTTLLDSRQNPLFNNLLIQNGVIAGTWKRLLSSTRVVVDVLPFEPLDDVGRTRITHAAQRYAAHLGLTGEVRITQR